VSADRGVAYRLRCPTLRLAPAVWLFGDNGLGPCNRSRHAKRRQPSARTGQLKVRPW